MKEGRDQQRNADRYFNLVMERVLGARSSSMRGIKANGLMRSRKAWRALIAIAVGGLLQTAVAQTSTFYTSGHISNVTFVSDYVMIMVDAGLPGNCTGTSWGWMKIPVANKAMEAFVVGLWMRGDAASTVVTVYTDGLVDGYCRITQIDPVG
jgi:hypothetical protein